jgi:hypothetical protein
MILRHVTIDCADPYRLASFWSEVTGWPLSGEDEPGDPEVLIEAPSPVPGLLFIQVPEAKTVKNRIHFDWMPTVHTRDYEVERIVGSGATLQRTRWRPTPCGRSATSPVSSFRRQLPCPDRRTIATRTDRGVSQARR